MIRGRFVACLAAALLACAGCGSQSGSEVASSPPAPEAEPALWTLAGSPSVGAKDDRVTVAATPAGCHSGHIMPLEEPQVTLDEDSVAIAITVAPTAAATANEDQGCVSSPPVEVVVTLPEPIGQRDLIDGGCNEDAFPSFAWVPECQDPVRYRG